MPNSLSQTYVPTPTFTTQGLASQSEVERLWLRGRGSYAKWEPIVAKNMRGIVSPGIWAGQYFKDDRGNDPEWERWRYWCDWWTVGLDVAAYLGVLADRRGGRMPRMARTRSDDLAEQQRIAGS